MKESKLVKLFIRRKIKSCFEVFSEIFQRYIDNRIFKFTLMFISETYKYAVFITFQYITVITYWFI